MKRLGEQPISLQSSQSSRAEEWLLFKAWPAHEGANSNPVTPARLNPTANVSVRVWDNEIKLVSALPQGQLRLSMHQSSTATVPPQAKAIQTEPLSEAPHGSSNSGNSPPSYRHRVIQTQAIHRHCGATWHQQPSSRAMLGRYDQKGTQWPGGPCTMHEGLFIWKAQVILFGVNAPNRGHTYMQACAAHSGLGCSTCYAVLLGSK